MKQKSIISVIRDERMFKHAIKEGQVALGEAVTVPEGNVQEVIKTAGKFGPQGLQQGMQMTSDEKFINYEQFKNSKYTNTMSDRSNIPGQNQLARINIMAIDEEIAQANDLEMN